MKKKILMFATVATLAVVMTACGSAQTSNNPTPTVEPTKEVEATTAPADTATPMVEPTTEPTVEPTATSTPTPEPTATSTPTPEPTATSTPTPEPTPTEAPTEPAGNPTDVAEDPNFAVIRDMAYGWLDNYYEVVRFYEYNEFESIIETMDKSRYVVNKVEGLDPVLRAGLTDTEKEENIKRFLSLYICTSGKIDGTYYSALTPTGELYTMTLTDLVTGETIVWGFRVHAENDFKPGNYVVQEFTTLSLMDMYTGSIDIDNSYIEKIKFIFGL